MTKSKLRGRTMTYTPICILLSNLEASQHINQPRTTQSIPKLYQSMTKSLKILNIIQLHLHNKDQQEEIHLKVFPNSTTKILVEGNVDVYLLHELVPPLLMLRK